MKRLLASFLKMQFVSDTQRLERLWGLLSDVTDTALENLNTFTILMLILKLLLFIYSTLHALSRISPSMQKLF